MGPKQLEFFRAPGSAAGASLLDVRNRDVGGWRPAHATRSDRRFRRGCERVASPRETTGMDDDQERKWRLLLLGKAAVLSHRLARPLAAELDEKQHLPQPVRMDTSSQRVAADCPRMQTRGGSRSRAGGRLFLSSMVRVRGITIETLASAGEPNSPRPTERKPSG